MYSPRPPSLRWLKSNDDYEDIDEATMELILILKVTYKLSF